VGAFIERRIAIPDVHRPAHHEAAWKLLLEVAKDFRPHEAILMGDYLDLESLSQHPKKRPDTIKLKDELGDGNKGLDELDRALPRKTKRRFLQGNHCVRSERFEAEFGQLDGMLSIPAGLGLKKRGWQWVSLRQQNRFVLGPVAYLHGISESKHHAMLHAEQFAPRIGVRHVTYGHMHTLQSAQSNAGYSARCCGFLGDERNIAFSYTKGRPTAWVVGFVLQEICGANVVETEVRIVNGRAVFNGRLYGGHK
jgi:hypothetical protein